MSEKRNNSDYDYLPYINGKINENCFINSFHKKLNNSYYDYQPLIDGKINGVEIKSITVCGCKYLDGGKCDGMHKIRIYGTKNISNINFASENRKFSTEELEKLNYIDKLRITGEDDWTCGLELCSQFQIRRIPMGLI